MSIPATSLSPDPSSLGVGIPSLQDTDSALGLPCGLTSSKESSASFDRVLDQVDEPSETADSDKSSAPTDSASLTPEQMAMMLSMVAPAPLVLPPPPAPPSTDDSSSNASSLTLVGAEGRSIPELLVRGTDVLEYNVSPAPTEPTSTPTQTDFAPLPGKKALQTTRGEVAPSPSSSLARPALPTASVPAESISPPIAAPAAGETKNNDLPAVTPEAESVSPSSAPAPTTPSTIPASTAVTTPSPVRSTANRPWDGRVYRFNHNAGFAAPLGSPAKTPSLPITAPFVPSDPTVMPLPNAPGAITQPSSASEAFATVQPNNGPGRSLGNALSDTAPAETPATEVPDDTTTPSAPVLAAAPTVPSTAAAAASTGNLPSPKTLPTGRSEKSAGSVLSGRLPGVKPSNSSGKNVRLDVDSEEVDQSSTEVGTNAANWGKTMYHETRNSPSAPVPGDALSFGSLLRNDSGTTKEEVKAVAPSHATDLVHEIREIADGLWAVERNSVEVKFNFSEQERLSVRVEYRDGAVQATFRTNSADVRDAIAREWQAQSGLSEQRPYRVAEPIFAPSASSAPDFSFGGDASRQQRSPEQQTQQQSGVFERFSLGTGLRSAPATTVSSTASSVSPRETTGRLHALV